MSRNLFSRVRNDLEQNYDFFQQWCDGRGKIGFSGLQKCTYAIRQLAYGTSSDSFDEYFQTSEKMGRECIYKFCKGVIILYVKKYLRKPNSHDIQQIYTFHEGVHGFPGMLGSLDCTHWEWDNCPTAWLGQFQRGDHHARSCCVSRSLDMACLLWCIGIEQRYNCSRSVVDLQQSY
ncbi:hypothetical protein E3N88_31313 [Mikania micrantha]|uniref:Uncharacterized protein n=1 Tax=Mikania micrantha TaxID=192012 RepID=A0A5N6MPY8_9ASTR|nr:hypothetical protein E3N88_31313 [Mikania micrantha]